LRNLKEKYRFKAAAACSGGKNKKTEEYFSTDDREKGRALGMLEVGKGRSVSIKGKWKKDFNGEKDRGWK